MPAWHSSDSDSTWSHDIKSIKTHCGTFTARLPQTSTRLFSVNRLSLNLGKTNYMLFRSRPPDNELALKVNNVVLPRVAATKFLGIIIDDKLSWKPHIQSVKSKLSSVLSIMYKASKLINITGMYTLYCSLFHYLIPIQCSKICLY